MVVTIVFTIVFLLMSVLAFADLLAPIETREQIMREDLELEDYAISIGWRPEQEKSNDPVSFRKANKVLWRVTIGRNGPGWICVELEDDGRNWCSKHRHYKTLYEALKME